MKRASYRTAIAWIAENDGAGDMEANDAGSVSCNISSILIADLFDIPQSKVGRDVVAYRIKRGLCQPKPEEN